MDHSPSVLVLFGFLGSLAAISGIYLCSLAFGKQKEPPAGGSFHKPH